MEEVRTLFFYVYSYCEVASSLFSDFVAACVSRVAWSATDASLSDLSGAMNAYVHECLYDD